MMEAQNIVETPKFEIPLEFNAYIESKKGNGAGGRPHFVQALAKRGDPIEQIFNILEEVWIKAKPMRQVANKYGIENTTMYRFLKDLELYKEPLVQFLLHVPRRKVWFNPDLQASDYDSVQAYIKKAKRTGLRSWKSTLNMAEGVWKFLNYKDPAHWVADDVIRFFETKTEGSQSGYLDAIRQVAPQIRDSASNEYVGTGRFREKLRIRKKDLFSNEVNMIIEALRSLKLDHHLTLWQFHITGAFREGTKDKQSGIAGITWDRFKENFARVDDYERKVRGGIWWRDCPTDLFFKDLPERLKALWIRRGKPISEPVVLGGYTELSQMYKEIRKALAKHFEGKLEPSLYKEITSLRPHDADKIHVNLLWEAGVPLEVVAGQFLGRGEGIGLMGRGWLDVNVIKKHYLSLTARSKRFQEIKGQVDQYSKVFCKVD